MFHELLSRDHEDGRATWQPQGVGSEAYLNGTSQEPTSEDARKDGHIIRARYAPLSHRTASGICDKRVPSFVVAVTPRREFMKYPD